METNSLFEEVIVEKQDGKHLVFLLGGASYGIPILTVLDVPGIYGTQEIFQKDSRNFGENGSEVSAGRIDAAVMASGGQNLSGYDPQIQQICH
jgi:hypothetical protein